ncbi:hypothetical protein HaLaN_30556 [Haematococcus lacustris]|uniref:Uncharacterized protein n=1 Tax=Haematococcus lacustris TaxID=44745 RepID=A0A6A0AFI5_HAELA|nr:hypothetical protein HaLaN_30556 [Haematococcus lacustris]
MAACHSLLSSPGWCGAHPQAPPCPAAGLCPWACTPPCSRLAAPHLKHITVTLATWNAVWEVYLDPSWARQRLRLYGAQDRALEQFFKRLEEEMAELSMKHHGRAKQLAQGHRPAAEQGSACG